MERARERLRATGRRTVFFLDEIHRFNKAQQDALLPAVEDGLVTLIGATTENPFFSVNSALISRRGCTSWNRSGPRTCACCSTGRSSAATAGPRDASRPRRSSSSPSARAAMPGRR